MKKNSHYVLGVRLTAPLFEFAQSRGGSDFLRGLLYREWLSIPTPPPSVLPSNPEDEEEEEEDEDDEPTIPFDAPPTPKLIIPRELMIEYQLGGI